MERQETHKFYQKQRGTNTNEKLSRDDTRLTQLFYNKIHTIHAYVVTQTKDFTVYMEGNISASSCPGFCSMKYTDKICSVPALYCYGDLFNNLFVQKRIQIRTS